MTGWRAFLTLIGEKPASAAAAETTIAGAGEVAESADPSSSSSSTEPLIPRGYLVAAGVGALAVVGVQIAVHLVRRRYRGQDLEPGE